MYLIRSHYFLFSLSAFLVRISIAFIIASGSGSPIKPAFSTMLINSLAMNPIITAPRIYSTPKARSRRYAINP